MLRDMFTNEQDVLRAIESYAASKKMAESTFGRLAANDGKLVDSLRAGKTLTLKTVQKIQAYIENNPLTDEEVSRAEGVE